MKIPSDKKDSRIIADIPGAAGFDSRQKSGLSFGRKAEAPVCHSDMDRLETTMNAACSGVRIFTRHHSLLHHSRDSSQARFIPMSLFGHAERIASRVC